MDLSGFDPKLVAVALMASGLVKYLVDAVRLVSTIPAYGPPALAILFGVAIGWLITESAGTPVDNRQDFATIILVGLIAAGLATGATAIQSARKPTEPAPPATTTDTETVVRARREAEDKSRLEAKYWQDKAERNAEKAAHLDRELAASQAALQTMTEAPSFERRKTITEATLSDTFSGDAGVTIRPEDAPDGVEYQYAPKGVRKAQEEGAAKDW